MYIPCIDRNVYVCVYCTEHIGQNSGLFIAFEFYVLSLNVARKVILKMARHKKWSDISVQSEVLKEKELIFRTSYKKYRFCYTYEVYMNLACTHTHTSLVHAKCCKEEMKNKKSTKMKKFLCDIATYKLWFGIKKRDDGVLLLFIMLQKQFNDFCSEW